MSVPSVVHGGYFDIAVDVTGLGLVDSDSASITGYIHLCGLTSKTMTHQVNTSDEAIPDCGNPEEVPWVTRTSNSQEKTIAGTGLHNRAQTNIIRAIFGKTLPYRFIEGEPGNDLVSQGYWEGKFLFSNWQEGATDIKGNVTSQFSFVSDSEVDWTSSSAPTLGALALTTTTATVDDEWSSAITGATSPSQITAVSDDGTVLTVDGDTVTGTFSTAGTPSVTLIEINPEANNSPKTTSVTVTVSA